MCFERGEAHRQLSLSLDSIIIIIIIIIFLHCFHCSNIEQRFRKAKQLARRDITVQTKASFQALNRWSPSAYSHGVLQFMRHISFSQPLLQFLCFPARCLLLLQWSPLKGNSTSHLSAQWPCVLLFLREQEVEPWGYGSGWVDRTVNIQSEEDCVGLQDCPDS